MRALEERRVQRMLARLAKLDGNDPFWQSTCRRPAVSRVHRKARGEPSAAQACNLQELNIEEARIFHTNHQMPWTARCFSTPAASRVHRKARSEPSAAQACNLQELNIEEATISCPCSLTDQQMSLTARCFPFQRRPGTIGKHAGSRGLQKHAGLGMQEPSATSVARPAPIGTSHNTSRSRRVIGRRRHLRSTPAPLRAIEVSSEQNQAAAGV